MTSNSSATQGVRERPKGKCPKNWGREEEGTRMGEGDPKAQKVKIDEHGIERRKEMEIEIEKVIPRTKRNATPKYENK